MDLTRINKKSELVADKLTKNQRRIASGFKSRNDLLLVGNAMLTVREMARIFGYKIITAPFTCLDDIKSPSWTSTIAGNPEKQHVVVFLLDKVDPKLANRLASTIKTHNGCSNMFTVCVYENPDNYAKTEIADYAIKIVLEPEEDSSEDIEQIIQKSLSDGSDVLVIVNDEENAEGVVGEILDNTEYEIRSAYACNPNDLGLKDSVTGEHIPPMWASDAIEDSDTAFVLHLEHIQECTSSQLSVWKTFLQERKICGEYIGNVVVCAEYVVYPDEANPKTSQDSLQFFDTIIRDGKCIKRGDSSHAKKEQEARKRKAAEERARIEEAAKRNRMEEERRRNEEQTRRKEEARRRAAETKLEAEALAAQKAKAAAEAEKAKAEAEKAKAEAKKAAMEAERAKMAAERAMEEELLAKKKKRNCIYFAIIALCLLFGISKCACSSSEETGGSGLSSTELGISNNSNDSDDATEEDSEDVDTEEIKKNFESFYKTISSWGTPSEFVKNCGQITEDNYESYKDDAYSKYEEVKDGAYDKYNAIKDKQYDAYEKIKDEEYEKYEKVKDEAYQKYQDNSIGYSEYRDIQSKAYDAYSSAQSKAYDAYSTTQSKAYDECCDIQSKAYDWYSEVQSLLYDKAYGD